MKYAAGSDQGISRHGQEATPSQGGKVPRHPGRPRRTLRELPTALGGYWGHHWQSLRHSLGQLMAAPVASLMTVAVIGISLALPSGLYVLLNNVQQVSGAWEHSVQISLFLKKEVDGDAARALAQELQTLEAINAVDYISPRQAMQEFRQFSGFGDVLNALPDNPFPPALVVYPAAGARQPGAVEPLLQHLRDMPEVELANADMQWLERLFAVMEVAQRGVLILAALFALGVLLIVGNTIRLAILNRREEIEIKKLIGATNAFVRRPFLYTGCWYGVFGGLFACILVYGSLWLLQGPVQRLTQLYGGGLSLSTLEPGTALAVVLAATTLGYLGAWLAVGRHLSAIEPS